MGERRSRTGRSLVGRFGRDRAGAIAPLAAVVITAMLIGTFSAIDIARLVTARTQLQDAVDSATLALARMPQSTSDADMKTKATAWITANVTDPDIQDLSIPVPVRTLGQVQLNVTADIKTTSAALLGVTTLPISGHSTVKYGTTHVELALVLDNTGSMNDDSKLSSLKTAATTLVNTLNASAQFSGDAGALKVGIVPFSMAVNVGASNQAAAVGAGYLTGKMPAEYGANADALGTSHPDRFALLQQMGVSWGGCVESRPIPYDVQDTPPSSSNKATQFVPYFAPDEPDSGYYQYSGQMYAGSFPYNYAGPVLYSYGSTTEGTNDNPDYAKSPTVAYNGSYYRAPVYSENNYLSDGVNDSWNNSKVGGVWLNHQNATAKYTTKPAIATSVIWGDTSKPVSQNSGGQLIGPNAGCTVQAIQPLTTDISSVTSQISSMVAGGDTEIPLGLMWGWHVLSPNPPFASGTAYGTSGTIKVIVLVTDGANTYGTGSNPNLSHYTAYGYAANKRIGDGTASGVASALNDRLSTLCSNMKTKNADGTWKINIYTVPLEVSDAGIKSLLQGCVTDPANYLDVASSSQLADAFANIAGSISALRVSH